MSCQFVLWYAGRIDSNLGRILYVELIGKTGIELCNVWPSPAAAALFVCFIFPFRPVCFHAVSFTVSGLRSGGRPDNNTTDNQQKNIKSLH